MPCTGTRTPALRCPLLEAWALGAPIQDIQFGQGQFLRSATQLAPLRHRHFFFLEAGHVAGVSTTLGFGNRRLMPQSSVDPVVAQNLRATLMASGRSAYAVAASLGYAPYWLYRVIIGESGILIPTLREVAGELGVSTGSLLDGPEEIKETTDDAVWLVEAEAKPESRAAGYDETFSRRLRIPRELLPDPNINPLYCQMVRIEGNKLQPDLPDGTIVFLDRLRRELEDGKTFMLVTEEGLLMREVGFHGRTQQWTIAGRNGSPDDFRFTEDIRIIGQVIGALKLLL